MTQKQITDEDSLSRVTIDLISSHNRRSLSSNSSYVTNHQPSSTLVKAQKSVAKEDAISSLKTNVLNAYHMLFQKAISGGTMTLTTIGEIKAYILTKMFWGRGSLYRYIAFSAILIPIIVSLGLVYVHLNQPVKEKKLTITSSAINQAVTSANTSEIQGNLVVSDTPLSTSASELISWYSVKKGDTLTSIAKAYNINPDIIKWANHMSSDSVTPGEQIKIMSVQGIIHTVQSGDTIASLSSYYHVDPSQISDWNLIDSSKPLPVGESILITGVTSNTTVQTAPVTELIPLVSARPTYTCPADDSWCYMQTDPSWGNMILGGSGARNAYSSINIAQSGCLITDVAMLAQYYFPSKHITPATIAYSPYNFVGGGLYNLSGLGIFNVAPLGGIFGGVNWSQINGQIDLGHPVIVYMWNRAHYVVLYKRVGNDYLMNDPAYGGELLFSKYYSTHYVDQAFLFTPR